MTAFGFGFGLGIRQRRGGGTPTPTPFSVGTSGRMAIIGDSIDIGPNPDGFLEAMGQKLYVPAGWNFAVAGTEVIYKSQPTSPYWSSTPSDATQTKALVDFMTAQGSVPDVIYIGGYENSITHADTDTNILSGYSAMIAYLRGLYPAVKFLIQQMAASWVSVADDGQTKVNRAAAVWNGLKALNTDYILAIDAGHYVDPALGSAAGNIVGYDNTSLTAYDHNIAGYGYNTAGGLRQDGSGHPNTAKGAPLYGQIMAAQVLPFLTGTDASLFPTDTGDLPQNQEINPSYAMGGTSGTISSGGTGVLADNCTWTNTSDVSASLSKGALANGAVAQVISFSGTAAQQGVFRNVLAVSPAGGPLKAGKAYTIDVELEISNNAGTGDAMGLYHLALNNTSGNAIGFVYQTSHAYPNANALKRTTIFRIRTKVLTADQATLNVELYGLTDARALDIKVKEGRTWARIAKSDPVNRVIDLAAISSVAEGTGSNSTKTLTITRGHTVGTINVPYAVTGSGANPLNAADFVGGVFPSGTIQIAAGANSGSVTFDIAGDSSVEPDEQGTATITSPGGTYTLGTASRTFTVVDDDGAAYDSDASVLFARMTAAPTTTKKQAISDFIAGGKTDGWWAKLTYLRVHGLHDLQSSLLNWTALTSTYDGTVTGTGLVQTPGVGIAGDNTSSFIDSHYATPSGNQDNAHIGLWSLSSGQFASAAMGNNTSQILPRNASDLASVRLTGSVSQTTAATDGTGHIVVSRSGSANYTYYRNGGSATTLTRTSTTPDTNTMRELGKANSAGYWGGSLFCAHAGTALTATDVSNLYARLTTLKAALV